MLNCWTAFLTLSQLRWSIQSDSRTPLFSYIICTFEQKKKNVKEGLNISYNLGTICDPCAQLGDVAEQYLGSASGIVEHWIKHQQHIVWTFRLVEWKMTFNPWGWNSHMLHIIAFKWEIYMHHVFFFPVVIHTDGQISLRCNTTIQLLKCLFLFPQSKQPAITSEVCVSDRELQPHCALT